jgi:hypothetical protein
MWLLHPDHIPRMEHHNRTTIVLSIKIICPRYNLFTTAFRYYNAWMRVCVCVCPRGRFHKRLIQRVLRLCVLDTRVAWLRVSVTYRECVRAPIGCPAWWRGSVCVPACVASVPRARRPNTRTVNDKTATGTWTLDRTHGAPGARAYVRRGEKGGRQAGRWRRTRESATRGRRRRRRWQRSGGRRTCAARSC